MINKEYKKRLENHYIIDGRGHVWEARGLFPDRGRVTVVFDDAGTPCFIPDDIVVAVFPALKNEGR